MNEVAQYIQSLITSQVPTAQVHIGRPYIRDAKIVQGLIMDTDGKSVHCYAIERVSQTESPHSTCKNLIETNWRIEGFYAVDKGNTNYKTFQSIMNILIHAFRNDDNLGHTVNTTTTQQQTGLQLQASEYAWLMGALLCHRAEFTLITRQFFLKGQS